MNIFKEAKKRQSENKGYNARRFHTLWKSKKVAWNFIAWEYGIRRSDKWQIFPIWNSSHNCQRALLFGIGKLYIEIIYHRKNSFNHKVLFTRKFSQLIK